MKNILNLIRVKHWIKNIMVLAPACFISINEWNKTAIIRLLSVFVSFCLSASIVYILNDIADQESDLLHPQKKHRPIACGKINTGQALLILSGLVLLLVAVIYVTHYINYLVIAYILLNLFYSFWLKNVPIVDLLMISTCYLLRLLAGVLTLKIAFSFWLPIAVFFITLSVITGKRRNEILHLEDWSAHRNVLGDYNIEFLTYIILISAIIAINSYILYAYEQYTRDQLNLVVILSIPVLLFGVFKYLYNIFIKNQGGDPVEEILRDRSLVMISATFLLFSIGYTFKG